MVSSGETHPSLNSRSKRTRLDVRRWLIGILVIAVFMGVAYFGVRANLARQGGPLNLVVYAFSTQEEVLTQTIFPEFEKDWEARTGRKVEIEGLFGPSGTMASQIILGAPADVAVLSNEQHVNWLKMSKHVQPQTKPIVVSSTPMVIVTRPGNPWGIKDYADLVQEGLNLVHADPRTSGAGDWALLAEYGSELRRSNDPAIAEENLKAIWNNVKLMGASARAALTLFELGAGDALVTYEQDALLAQARGVPLEIVIPEYTIIAEHVVVLVEKNLIAEEQTVAEALVDFLLSENGQQAFIQYHLRPAVYEDRIFPQVENPFFAADLGGWSKIYPQVMEKVWQTQIQPRLKLEETINLLNSEQD